MDRELLNDKVEFLKAGTTWVAYEKIYEPTADEVRTKKFTTWLDDVGTSANGTDDLKSLFPEGVPFDFPKPVSLVKRLLQIAGGAQDDTLILDFFAGSNTTAQAVLELNREDEGQRSFISVQLPTQIDNPELRTIVEIGKERTRRVIFKMQTTTTPRLTTRTRKSTVDLGFKVFKLGRSNYKPWQDYQGDNPEALQARFDQIETPLVEGYSDDGLLTEVMLLQGYPLDSTVLPQPQFEHNTVKVVETDAFAHRMVVCLDDAIHADTVAALHMAPEDIFVCLDAALTENSKVELADRCNLKII